MARVPEIIRRNTVSQVAARPAPSGQGFAAIAELADIAADYYRPKAREIAREEGEKAVYRADDGSLQVDEKSVLSGEFGEIHNSAAYAKYLSQKQIDIQNTFSEMSTTYEFDPDGFQKASSSYVKILREDEKIPSVLKEDMVSRVEEEANRRFNGIYRNQVRRDQNDADVGTKTAREMLVDDYVSLYMAGDAEAAEAKLAEIQEITNFRRNAPYIGDTPEEGEAYMRGVRGSAKAARLTRELTDLDGATSITDEKRAEILETLGDPDIDPKVRQSLYMATQGRLKGIDGRAIAAGMTDRSYEAKVIRVESGGRANAKAKTSSATGHHQFIKSTWMNLVQKYKPSWAKGLSTGQILALRSDPAKSAEMFQHFRRENQAILANGGVPVNDGTEYMAHFFGAGGAVKVYNAAPNTPIEQVVGADKVKANPFLKGMTTRDAINWAARKMTMKASDMAAMAVEVAAIPDPEKRAAASAYLNNEIRVQQALEQATAETYKERLAQGDTVTAQEILEDMDLDTDMQISLLNTLKGMQKAQDQATEATSRVLQPNPGLNPLDARDRKTVDTAYQASLGEVAPMSDEGIAKGVALTNHTGAAPKSLFDGARLATKSNDPLEVSRGFEVLGQLLADQPASIDGHSGQATARKDLAEWRQLAQYRTAEEAGQMMIDRREEIPKNVTDQAKEEAKQLVASDLTDHFDQRWTSDPKFATERQEDVAMSDYRRIYQEERMRSPDSATAKVRALEVMDRIWGVSEITGSQILMRFPAQKFYPAIRGSHDWMSRQLEDEVNYFLSDGHAKRPEGRLGLRIADGGVQSKPDKWIKATSMRLHSDAQTRADIDAGRPPSYVIYYKDGDKVDQLPQRFVFDPSADQANAEAEFEAARKEAIGRFERRQVAEENMRDFGLVPR